ncbi:MAG: SDR family oxidoreductase [Candidatus Omnitrophica bacterium]|nr:SDR family oxidoreductase [Candidatus Omnitrophota bacterium]
MIFVTEMFILYQPMNPTFKGKTALITGASRGIGRSIAFHLAQRGAQIVINYVRNEETARATQDALSQFGIKTLLYQANVGDPKSVDEMVRAAVSEFGGIDILIHNAALGALKPTYLLKSNQWDLSLEVNTKAFLVLTQKVLPYMEKKGGGSIVAISSLGAQRVIPNYGAIGISKSALETLVKYLGAELAPKGIRVNCVSGGAVDTDALKAFPNYENLKKEIVKRTPAGRMGEPDDLARVVVFLVSPESGWIYGQTIIADGGLSLI